jgi:hypothetical protein
MATALANADTGALGTIAFGTTAFVAAFRLIGETKQARPVLDKTALEDTGAEKKMPGDNHSPGEIEIEFFWDAKVAPPSITAVPETITLTLPKSVAASAAAATVIGTGFISERTLAPKLARNEVNMGTAKVQFDGATGPAYTVEA